MRSNKGVSMITLIITIIVIIILAAIAFIGFDDATGGAQFAKFEQEFGDYAINFESNTVGKIKENNAVDGNVLTTAQMNYEAATKNAAPSGHIIPAGEEFNNLVVALKVRFPDQTLLTLEETDADGNIIRKATQCYPITDSNVKGYKDDHEFYGNNLGDEKHYVTQNGDVFTVPGYPREVDGENRMYVTTELYYVTDEGYSDIADITTSEPGIGTVVNGGTVDNNGTPGGETPGGETPGGETPDEEPTEESIVATIKAGEFVAYTADIDSSIQWRVWGKEGNNVLIIPTAPVGKITIGYNSYSDPTAQKLAKCLDDYTNLPSRIEELCKQYTSSSLGVTSANIKSLTLSDVEEKISNLDEFLANYTESGVRYGTVKTFVNREGTGKYYIQEYNEGTGENEFLPTFTAASETYPIKLKQTAYHLNSPSWETLYEGSTLTYGDILSTTDAYLPERAVYCFDGGDNYTENANFGIFYVSKSRVGNKALLKATGPYASATNVGVLPIISLDASAFKIASGNPGDGSSATPWNLEKK